MSIENLKTSSICIVIPCHNTAPSHLAAAIESVVAERESLEAAGACVNLILVDDASSEEETQAALQRCLLMGDWIHLVSMDKNSGASAARNKGVELSSAEWIAFMDADDYWLPGGMTRLFHELKNNPQIDWISGDFYYQLGESARESISFYPNHPNRFRHVQKAYESQAVILLDRPVEAFMDGNLCSMGSCLIKRQRFLAAGKFDVTLSKGDDTELYWRLARTSLFAFAPWPVFVYRRHAASMTGDGGILTEWEPPVLRRMIAGPEWRGYSGVLRRRLINSLDANIIYYRKQHKRLLAIKAIVSSLGCNPFRRSTWRHFVATLTVG